MNFQQKIDLSYIAGCIDSDGSFSIIKSSYLKKKTNTRISTWCAWIQIAQIDSEAINLMKKVFPFYNAYYEQIHNDNRLFFRLIFTGKKAYKVAKILEPFLHIKKRQAKLFPKIKLLLNEAPEIKFKTKRWSKGHKTSFDFMAHKLSQNQKNKRNQLVKEMRKLNGTL